MNNRVLIVDDVLFMRLKVRNMIEAFGYHVVGEAANGKEAFEKYQYLRPDLVLLDITMPEMDGVDCLKYIKQIDPKAKVIMVSAMGQGEFIKQCFKYGAEYFIRKPFDDEKVRKVMNAVLPLPEPEEKEAPEGEAGYTAAVAAVSVKSEGSLGALQIGRKKR